MRTTVIKLGSSIVAAPDGALREDVLARICDAVAALHGDGDRCVLVSSGAIARGVQVMGLSVRPTAIPELQAASAVGQGKLYRVWDELLHDRGVTSAQVLLTAGDVAARAQYLNARHTLRALLDWRVVPVVNENDTTATDEISFGDNDFLAAQVATLVGADLLVLLTDIDGLHSADPRLDSGAELIGEVQLPDDLEALEIGDSTSPLGSGGMRSKVLAAEIAGAAGIPAVICNGTRSGALRAALAGEPAGTRFRPGPVRDSSFKLWLRYAKPAQGTVIVDAGAARALREHGTSLLPVGVLDVHGDFDAGDAVDIVELDPEGTGGVRVDHLGAPTRGEDTDGEHARRPAGSVLAKGLCNYSSQELRRVKGLKSDAIRELLPHATDEAVHRDQLVLA